MHSPSARTGSSPRAPLGALIRQLSLLLLATVWAPAVPASAQTESEAPKVRLDRLLELPAGREYKVDKRGGRTQMEWRKLFTGVEEELAAAEKALAEAEEELSVVADASTPWQVGPSLPGVTNVDAPLDYQLRQEIRRQRSEIERLEGRRNELAVEADLAGVPPEWRELSEPAS